MFNIIYCASVLVLIAIMVLRKQKDWADFIQHVSVYTIISYLLFSAKSFLFYGHGLNAFREEYTMQADQRLAVLASFLRDCVGEYVWMLVLSVVLMYASVLLRTMGRGVRK